MTLPIKRSLYLAAATAVLAVGALVFFKSGTEIAPESKFVLLDGSSKTTAELKGRVTLVNFWATSCVTCVAEMPKIIATYNKYHSQGFDTIAVAMSYDPPAYVVNYAQTRQLPFNVAIDNTGAMDRNALRALVFSDASAKARLEAIIHPLVREAGAKAVLDSRSNFIVHDIPLLVESGRSRASFDSILVIDCTEATQVERVTVRSGQTPDHVRQVIANQASRAQRLQVADNVVFNDGISLQQLRQRIEAVASAVVGTQ